MTYKRQEISATVRDLTHGEFYSLQDVSVALNVSKRTIMNHVRDMQMTTIMLFHKYTVFTRGQVYAIMFAMIAQAQQETQPCSM